MAIKRPFYKELRFLEKDYGFEFLTKSKCIEDLTKSIGIEKRFVFKKNNFEIGVFNRTTQFDWFVYFYFSINAQEEIINIEEEFYELFNMKSKRRYCWQLGMIVKEHLKQNRIFKYYL